MRKGLIFIPLSLAGVWLGGCVDYNNRPPPTTTEVKQAAEETAAHGAALAEKATLGHRHPHAAVGVLGRTAVVDLAVAITYNDPAHEVARDIQRQVIATLRDQVGLQSVKVNVTVDDILGDDER